MRNANYRSTCQAVARSLPGDFEPDADLGKPIWQGVPALTLHHYRKPGTLIPGVNTRVAVAYTGSRLYLAYRCQYFEMHCYQGEDPSPGALVVVGPGRGGGIRQSLPPANEHLLGV